MNIVIVGGGLVGSTLAAKLARDGHDISLVEHQSDRIRELSESLDVGVISGNGATARVLRAAGIERSQLVVATTDNDESNMVIGLLASALFKVPQVVVRLRDDDHVEGFSLVSRERPVEHVFVDPDAAAVDRIVTLLDVPGALDVASFLDDRLLVAGFRIMEGSDFAGLLVSHMELLFAGAPTLVAAIHRGSDWIIPHGDEEIRLGDLVYFAIDREQLEDVLALVGALHERRRNVMIAGADRLGLALARRLEASDTRVIMIEEDGEKARRAVEQLNETVVVHGPVTDQALLEEEEIERVATFVALTPDHETNLVAGLLAKRLGAARAFALVDNPALVNLIGNIGIDAIISPRLLTIGFILQHIHGARVSSVAPLLEDRVEVVEGEAAKGSRLTSAPLANVGLPRGVLVAAVRRGNSILVPRGADRVEAGDRVLLITTTESTSKVTDLLIS